ncbi:glycosyltransferase family 4 protein [Sporolactobacillus sp. STSJ-5]|uniref:glycosyltransferase family 4 protein n=1 Tax=Sporolactobacillus sp. STSJ-5 TaxID=2965076 RepID=UPI0021050DD9|nr:glycosyltransferase family 4 protein [Sporolactobacillus sp. STSJ-5]MCQ2009522.1 glycosyltransferase family 4 protein [Sporolactobacillus sp. STSJ-5]
MKILLISVTNGQINRGVESWTNQIMFHMSKNGEDVRLIQGGDEIPKFLIDYSEKINIVKHKILDLSGDQRFSSKIRRRLGIYTTDIEVRKFYRKIEKYIAEENPDILLSVSGELKELYRIKKNYNLKAKMVIVGHAGIPKDVKFSDAFIALSERDFNSIVLPQPQKIYCVNNGVDTNLFSTENVDKTVTQRYSSLPKPIILCVSALVPYKRVQLLVDAYSLLQKGSLIIIGDGPEKRVIQEKIDNIRYMSNKDDIKLISHVPFSEMPSYFSLADVFVHPADSNEAFGSVIVEALAMGKAVVANNDEVRKKIVGDVGFLVNAADVQALSNTIEKAFSDSNDKELIRARRQKSLDFSWEKVVGDYLEIFREVMS